MEYLLGAIAMLVTLNIVNRSVYNKVGSYKRRPPKISQSRSMELAGLFSVRLPSPQKPLVSQATKHFEKNHLRVVIMENSAYWIFEHSLYVADIIDGQIDQNSTKIVDTMALDKVQLDKMIFVVEQLSGGSNNDSGYSGDSQL